MTVYVVSSAAQFNAAIAKAAGGDRIEMKAGNYGDLRIQNEGFQSDVVIAAHDPATPPKVNSMSLWATSHITFDGIDFDFTPTATTVEWSAALRMDASSDITIRNSTFTGGDAVAGIDPNAPAGTQGSQGIMGFPIGVGISAYNSQRITITNTEISEFTAGVRFSNVDHITMDGNEIFNVRKVPVGGGDVSNVTMTDNYFHDLTPWKFGGLGDHGDFVHFWTTPGQTTPSANFVFADNVFMQGNGVPVLGIYLDDNTNDMGFRNVLIEGNVMHNGNAQGLRMEDVVGLVVRNNTMLQSSGDAFDAPKIYLADGTRNVLIDGNIYAGVVGPALQNLSGNNISIVNNIVVQIHNPLAADYVGNLFVNAMADLPTLADLRPIPGSMADGYGSDLGDISAARQPFDGFVNESRGSGLALSTHLFNVLDGDNTDGNNIPVNAIVRWDFGDGTKALGAAVSHTFGAAGSYVTKATVTLPSGQVYTIAKTVEVVTPVAVHSTFDRGLLDSSDLPQQVTAIGQVSLIQSDFGQSVKLGGPKSAVKFGATAEILDNPEFTISLAFKKNAGAEAAGGRIFYFSGTAVIDLSADNIALRGKTSTGESIVLQSSGGVGIKDDDWHQVTYTFSKAAGTAILYVDGVEAARMDGLTGGQFTTSGHSMHLGNPFGANMAGLLDNASFLRGVLTPQQVQQSYASFEQGNVLDYSTSPATTILSASVIPAQQPTDVIVEVPPTAPQVLDSLHKDDWDGYVLNPHSTAIRLVNDAKVVQTAHGTGIRLDGDQDYVALGRMTNLEASDRVAFSVDFTRDTPGTGAERLVWNHQKLGLTLKDDGLIVQVATANQGLKAFNILNLGLDDSDLHRVTVMVDAQSDRLQVLLDDKIVLDERNTDFEIVGAGGRESGWSIGTAWDRYFDGDVTDFRLGDRFEFLDGSTIITSLV